MSENNKDSDLSSSDNSSSDDSFDYASNDVITDLKTGIYNLYVNLLQHLTIDYGPVEAIKISTQFLDDISNTFKDTIKQTENNQND